MWVCHHPAQNAPKRTELLPTETLPGREGDTCRLSAPAVGRWKPAVGRWGSSRCRPPVKTIPLEMSRKLLPMLLAKLLPKWWRIDGTSCAGAQTILRRMHMQSKPIAMSLQEPGAAALLQRERNTEWSAPVEDLLLLYGEKARVLRWLFLHSATSNEWRSTLMTLPVLVLQAALGVATSVVSSHSPVGVSVGVVQVLLSLLLAIGRLYAFDERAMLCRQQVNACSSLIMAVESELALARADRGSCTSAMKHVLGLYRQLLGHGNILVDSVLQAYDRMQPFPRGHPQPDVLQGQGQQVEPLRCLRRRTVHGNGQSSNLVVDVRRRSSSMGDLNQGAARPRPAGPAGPHRRPTAAWFDMV